MHKNIVNIIVQNVRGLGQCIRETWKSCSVSVSCVTCGLCEAVRVKFASSVDVLLLLRPVAPLVSRSCVFICSFFFHFVIVSFFHCFHSSLVHSFIFAIISFFGRSSASLSQPAWPTVGWSERGKQLFSSPRRLSVHVLFFQCNFNLN